ncbi:MAG: PilT/PilU family type 4a pilus ATPase [bacterium]|nr:PilT/PilU family type 4a pilus ATPase [bacterium]
MSELQEILKMSLERQASDIHLVAGLKPLLRIHTELAQIEELDVLSPEKTEAFARELIQGDRYEDFLAGRDLDFSSELPGMGRFRVNTHFQRDTIGIALRAISSSVPALEDLNLPEVARSLVSCPRGLVLVTGPTGSGKSTALASMIDAMNQLYSHHVITLEDPIEYEIRSNKCVIEQREVGGDVTTFASGLRHALRQDPDIILVGEMRDLETTTAAISAAETGHLVLSTLHTQSASQTIERIIDIYPPSQQAQIQSMLSTTLQAVLSMALFKRSDGSGMVPACEVMLCNPAIRNCIRENRIHEIPNIITTNKQHGMRLFDDALKDLIMGGFITREQGLAGASRPEYLNNLLASRV